MAICWYAGIMRDSHWVPHPDCPPFTDQTDAQNWAEQWAKNNPDKPPLQVRDWDVKDS